MSAGLHAVAPGPAASIQDQGRPGYQRFGVTEGGAVDQMGHAAGAALLGQSPALASLEVALFGGTYRSHDRPLWMTVTGASMPCLVAGNGVASGTVFRLPPRSEVEFGPVESGTYSYVSVAGGWDVPEVLGSRSTHLRAGFGGYEGRTLRPGDLLPVGEVAEPPEVGRTLTPGAMKGPIRVVWALHAELFTAEARRQLVEGTFRVSAQRDRMGVRLETDRAMNSERTLILPSAPVVSGDLQIPGDGMPMALLADRQPTGGYPRIATIIRADLGRVAQMPSGTEFRFEVVSGDEAQAAGAEYRRALLALPDRVRQPGADAADLWDANLISGVTVGEEEPS